MPEPISTNPDTFAFGYAVANHDNWGTFRGFKPYTDTLCTCGANAVGHVHVIAVPHVDGGGVPR